MPRAIEGAHDAILQAAGHLLAVVGYDRLNIRAIAAECGLATGTIYNYYRAKDEIVFTLMLKDWETAIGILDGLVGRAEDCRQAEGRPTTSALLAAFFEAMHVFSSKYAPVWRRMALVPNEEKSPQHKAYRSEDFVGALEARMKRILAARNGEGLNPGETASIASLLIRVFSVYALDAEPDRAAMELFVGKLLQP